MPQNVFCHTVRNTPINTRNHQVRHYQTACTHHDAPKAIPLRRNPCYIVTHCVTIRFKTGRFTVRNGPFCSVKWAESHAEMGRFANQVGMGRTHAAL